MQNSSLNHALNLRKTWVHSHIRTYGLGLSLRVWAGLPKMCPAHSIKVIIIFILQVRDRFLHGPSVWEGGSSTSWIKMQGAFLAFCICPAKARHNRSEVQGLLLEIQSIPKETGREWTFLDTSPHVWWIRLFALCKRIMQCMHFCSLEGCWKTLCFWRHSCVLE